MRKVIFVVLGAAVCLWTAPSAAESPVRHVIVVSCDGLRADAAALLGEESRAFRKLMTEGAWTLNARTDHDMTVTLPNHTGMLTGRGVMGPQGHNYTENSVSDHTLHKVKGSYVSSVLDVVKKSGGSTAFVATKDKFDLYTRSYNAVGTKMHPDESLRGQNLIDTAVILPENEESAVNRTLEILKTKQPTYLFLHLAMLDRVGHRQGGWDVRAGSPYMRAVQDVDILLARLLDAVEADEQLRGSTVIIVTSDHGGTISEGHAEKKEPLNYTIPFLVWGADTASGKDLYSLNASSRRDPGKDRVLYSDPNQPIRNADAANLALSLLGLPPVPGSTVDIQQDLLVR